MTFDTRQSAKEKCKILMMVLSNLAQPCHWQWMFLSRRLF